MEEAVARETDLGAVAKHQDIRESFASNPEQRTHYTSSNGTGSAIEHYSANLTSPSQEYATPAGLVDSLNVGTISRLNQTIHLNLEENVRRNTHPPMLMHPRIGLNLSGGSVQESAQSSDQVNVPGDHVAKTKTRGRPSQSEVARFCGVCGDVAKSFHFGGLSCNSCKAFFRRSVENDLYLQFFCCRGRQSCVITKNNRKTCQHCRMRKCFEIGMQKRWVMTNEERKAAMKARAEKKSGKHVATDAVAASSEAQKDQEQQTSIASLTRESSSNYVPDVSRMTDHMSRAEIKEIEAIVIKYAEAYKQFPYRSELHSGDNKRPGFQIMEMLGTVVKRFALYARMIENFASLPSQDQRSLLKGGMLEVCLLRGALAFDPVNNRWPNTGMSIYKDAPVLQVADVEKLVSSSVIEKHLDFIRFLQNLGADEPTIMLLVLVVLFSSRPGVSRPDLVDNFQTRYTSLLKRYVDWRYGPGQSQKLFNKLLTKLSDLRELSENHNRQNLHFGNDELASIQQQLKDLKISPFPEFNVLDDTSNSRDVCRRQDTFSQPAPMGSQQKTPTFASVDNATSEQLLAKHDAVPKSLFAEAMKQGEVIDPCISSQHSQHQHVKMTSDQSTLNSQVPSRWPRELDSKNHTHFSVTQTAGFPPLPGMQFMDIIHHSINQQLDQAYYRQQQKQQDLALSNERSSRELTETLVCLPALFGEHLSPPSLNAADYEACFEPTAQNAGSFGNTCTESNRNESPSKSEAANTSESHASEIILLEEICQELVKCSETFCK